MVDLDALWPILRRVRATPPGLHPDQWMAAACPMADPGERVILRGRLADIEEPVMTRDPARIVKLQEVLRAQGLSAFLVPRADAHRGEYIVAGAERLAWLTGFTGSAGFAVIHETSAALFVDGRYTLQAPAETDASVISVLGLDNPAPLDWLSARLSAGAKVGFDPAITAIAEARRWREGLAKVGSELVAVTPNPIDALWTDQPGDPFAPVLPYPLVFAGETGTAKRQRIARILVTRGAEAAVLNQLDSIAWLLNVRGGDTPATPLVQSFLILTDDGHATWYVDPAKCVAGLGAHLGNDVTIEPISAFADGLDRLAGRALLVDPASSTAFVADRLTVREARLIEAADPVTLPKALKNPVELAGSRAAHRRDGAALVRFLAWFDGAAVGLDELQVAARLEEFRSADARHRGQSFSTIAGFGPNGAIVHYRASHATARRVEPGSFLLLDSGAQYLDGTTDVTRTLPVGRVPRDLKRHFTLVLRAHIALATARFPAGTTGVQLDAQTRRVLWDQGLDYDHGTGHGIGVYLGVHEGPQSISKRGTHPIEPGMIISNEPGCYVAGSHGIRIENLIVARPARGKAFRDRGFIEFETITLAPIDRRAILVGLLTADERAWVDAYHARVQAEIGPLVDGDAARWLARMTRPL